MNLREIEKWGGKVFDFEYPFYNEEQRSQFEKKFLLHFRYDEIGQETLQRFKYMLQDVLTYNFVKYEHIYKTQVKSQEFLWWFNKDLTVTNTREVLREDKSNSENINSNTNKSNSTSKDVTVSNDMGDSLSVFSDTPQGDLSNLDDYLTNASRDNNSARNDFTGNNTTDSLSDYSSKGNSTSGSIGNEKESYSSIEQGNIGTTSSADLIAGWLKDGLIDVDKEILKDCEPLFMGIY